MKKYSINWTQLLSYIVIISLSIALFNTCQKEKLATAISVNSKKLISESKLKAKKYEYQYEQYKDSADYWKKETAKFKKKSAKIETGYIPKIEGVKHYNSTDLANFYKKEYKLPSQVKTTEFGTCLGDSVAKLNIQDVFHKKMALAQIKEAKSIIKSQDSTIKFQDSAMVQKDSANVEKTKALTECEKANEVGKLEQKRVKKSNLLLKIGLGALAVLGIVF